MGRGREVSRKLPNWANVGFNSHLVKVEAGVGDIDFSKFRRTGEPPLSIPDRPWGNNPEPSFRMSTRYTDTTAAIIAERVDSLRSD